MENQLFEYYKKLISNIIRRQKCEKFEKLALIMVIMTNVHLKNTL